MSALTMIRPTSGSFRSFSMWLIASAEFETYLPETPERMNHVTKALLQTATTFKLSVLDSLGIAFIT